MEAGPGYQRPQRARRKREEVENGISVPFMPPDEWSKRGQESNPWPVKGRIGDPDREVPSWGENPVDLAEGG